MRIKRAAASESRDSIDATVESSAEELATAAAVLETAAPVER